MRRFLYGALLAIASLGLCTTSVWADLWGVNFQGRGLNSDGNTNAEALAPADVAGVMAQTNWNNDPTFYGASGLTTHTINSLMNSTGTSTSVSLTVSSTDSWLTSNPPTGSSSDANHKLMDGIVKATGSTPATLTLGNLVPGGAYTVIAYTIENFTGGQNVGAQSNNTLTIGNTKYFTTAPVDFNGTFTRAMNTNSAGPRDVGNYVEFDNVIADANGRIVLTDTFDGPSPQQDGTGIAAIQLQGPAPIPEPASAALLGFGAVVLIGMARRLRIL